MRDNKQAKEVEEVSGSQLKEENRILRYLIGRSHDGPKHRIYGDGGELQCSACWIDFVRDSAQDIQRKIEEAGMRELQRAMDAGEWPPKPTTGNYSEPPIQDRRTGPPDRRLNGHGLLWIGLDGERSSDPGRRSTDKYYPQAQPPPVGRRT